MVHKNTEWTVWAEPEERQICIQQGNDGIVIDVSQFGSLVKAIGLCADEIFRSEKQDAE